MLSLQPFTLRFSSARVLSNLAAAWLIVGGSSLAWSAEPARAFLDGLRERNYHDVALDYLATAEKSTMVPVEFKQTILYERGVTLVEGARVQRDSTLREKQLDEGQQTLTQFITAQPRSLLVIGARNQLGNVIVERARSRVEKSKKAADKATLLGEAKGLYGEAITVFEALIIELKDKLKTYPAALSEKTDPKRVEERDQFRKDYLQSQLLAAATREEMADTVKGTKEATTMLETAAKEYGEIYDKYRTRLAGLYARMYQGRCNQKLNKHKEALAFFGELLANPDAPEAFRVLKAKTLELAIDSWLAIKLYTEAIDKVGKLVDGARPAEDRTEEFMGMRVKVAQAQKLYADEIKATRPRDAQVKVLLTNGRKLVTYVSKFPGPYQDQARKMIADFTGGDSDKVAERPEPKTFMEARTAGKEAVEAMQTAGLIDKLVPAKIAQSKDATEKAELTKQLEDARKASVTAKDDALHYLRLALKFADKDVDVADVNLVRYLLCYLSYTDANYYDAVVMGEFIAKRYPDSQGARQCAKIAMASYLKLYAENKTEDKDYESQRIINICDYIVKKWPDQPEAEEAINTLIPFMIREGRLKDAQDYLDKIPLESPHRGNAELKLGQALWGSYLTGSKELRDWEAGKQPKPDDVDLAVKKTDLTKLKDQAKSTLIAGVERMKTTGDVNSIVATAVLSLVQIYVDTNEAPKAVVLMEDPKIGALTLVTKKDPAVERPGFAEETYKTALRAYISSLAASADSAGTVVKAKGIMESLKNHIGTTATGQQTLVAIYVSLARDLKAQMDLADADVKPKLGAGFEAFLKQVALESSELNILNWVAETYRGMGESFGGGKGGVSPEAKRYYLEAASTYEKILNTGKTNKAYLTAGMVTQLNLQLAKTKRDLGDYVGAMNTFEAVLQENAMLLPVQIEAARTYQDWAALSKPDLYMYAIVGARPGKNPADKAKFNKNVIWGWGEIARMTAGNPKFKDPFYEARYNLALCRYNYALAQKEAAKKSETLKMARRDITITVSFYPDLGGPVWEKQYDSLLRSIQKSLSEPPTGIAGLKAAAPPVTPVSGKAMPGKSAPSTAAPAKTSPAKAAAPSTKTIPTSAPKAAKAK